MKILGIETTCDETSMAVVESGKTILSHVIESQIPIHALYGGVFPEIASRHHVDKLIPVLDRTLKEANLLMTDIDAIGVAYGPGLMGSLLTGVEFAKSLAWVQQIPLIQVNHVKAHLYAAMMGMEEQIRFPVLGVIISGGHTHLVEIMSYTKWALIGCTQDDAIGEAFDKVGALLGLPYPGGPEVEKWAREGNPDRFSFKAGQVKQDPLNFSYSGLKTQVLYAVKGTSQKESPKKLGQSDLKDVAASFQKVAFADLIQKILLASEKRGLKDVFLGGGVSNNCYLRQELTKLAPPTLSIHFPPAALTVDNGAMIAGLAFQEYSIQKTHDLFSVRPVSRPVWS